MISKLSRQVQQTTFLRRRITSSDGHLKPDVKDRSLTLARPFIQTIKMQLFRWWWSLYCISMSVFIQCLNTTEKPLEQVKAKFGAGEILDSMTKIIISGERDKLRSARDCKCVLHACSNRFESKQECTANLGSLSSCGEDCTTRKVPSFHLRV